MTVGTSMQKISSLALLVRQLRCLAYHRKPVLNRVKAEGLFSPFLLVLNPAHSEATLTRLVRAIFFF